MNANPNIASILKLEKIVFDKIEFKRLGFQNDSELDLELQSSISKKKEVEEYRVALLLKGNKPKEYTLEIGISGFFNIESEDEITEDLKNTLITKNSVAIMMPYLRSELSLLTAQPETECVVLPAFNINKMLDDKK